MINQLLRIALIALFLIGCKSASKLVEEGNYDKAIEKSVKKMLKGNAKTEDKQMLDRAYTLANQQDNERIKLLKLEGKPENWEQVYSFYMRLDNRQKQVRKVLPFQIKGSTYNYKQIDYSASIIEAKIKAAEYFYAYGKQLMEQGQKEQYRQAYYNFNKVKRYRESAYPDINILIDEARSLGVTNVLVDVSNASNVQFPADFYDKLLTLNSSSLNSTWTDYSFGRTNRTSNYDYYVTIELQNVLISPESYSTKETERKKKVNDGFDYVLDSRGNVMKDTLGNDIKIPKYKYISCILIEREQFKETTIEAQVVYLQSNPHRIIKRESVGATSVFRHISAKAIGDIKALLPEDLELLNQDPLPFPNDISMIYDCLDPLKKAVEEILRSNKGSIH
jgi:hypothetical protein